ncbi:hypothetical protein A3K62_02220 [Candidatus Pacearchaeota archaeon RBG_16_35_8]|nr:MAG: hypothetical protein A3K62_02220 [Candidatus Pacearchaeota archaeon RBG_16_35_8]
MFLYTHLSFNTGIPTSSKIKIKSFHNLLLAVDNPNPLLLFPPSVSIIPFKNAILIFLFAFFILKGTHTILLFFPFGISKTFSNNL